jgi:hypothetical protein
MDIETVEKIKNKYTVKYKNPGSVRLVTNGKNLYGVEDSEGNLLQCIFGIAIRQNGSDLGTAILTRYIFKHTDELGLHDKKEYKQKCMIIGYILK